MFNQNDVANLLKTAYFLSLIIIQFCSLYLFAFLSWVQTRTARMTTDIHSSPLTLSLSFSLLPSVLSRQGLFILTHHICSGILKCLFHFLASSNYKNWIGETLNEVWRMKPWLKENETHCKEIQYKNCHGACQIKQRHSGLKGIEYKFFLNVCLIALNCPQKVNGKIRQEALNFRGGYGAIARTDLFHQTEKQIAKLF